ncbi:MAG: hypothetical protein RBG13Loki_0515 [Promethearchaeota archaeon CR_4]|nr:MAG: hypothetical protein RBG13Loki_0515 [Candidatus Lokiarchaeota archaeon CR_4]
MHVFRNLMDFAENVQKVADEEIAVRFRVIARYFIDKDRIPSDILLKSISEIINLKDDAFEALHDTFNVPMLEIVS